METKQEIRARILKKRSAMTAAECEDKSRRIFETVIQLPAYKLADSVFAYIDYRNEVSTEQILLHAWQSGKKTAVPRVHGDEMKFYYISSFDDLETGYKGIREPRQLEPAKEAEFILVPGVAFDPFGRRIGYGKGFYDKYLSLHPDAAAIGLAYELQIEAALPEEALDIKIRQIVTERKLYNS